MNAVTLSSGDARAEIALLGAEARRWAVGGRDLLWQGDSAYWADVSPILYPVVGWTRDGARVGKRQYALGLHGFARFETFAVEAAAPISSASSSATTRARAPSIRSHSSLSSSIG